MDIEKFLNQINELIIDGEIVEPCTKYQFNSTGIHKVYFKINISNITSLDYLFQSILNVTSISFSPLFNTENITFMRWMFSSCYTLTSIDVSHFNT